MTSAQRRAQRRDPRSATQKNIDRWRWKQDARVVHIAIREIGQRWTQVFEAEIVGWDPARGLR